MSELLDELIAARRSNAIAYEEYLEKIVELTKQAKNPADGNSYPAAVNTAAKKALYDNLGNDEALTLAVDGAVRGSLQDDWRGAEIKTKKVKIAIKGVLGEGDPRIDAVLTLVISQHEY